MVHYYKIIHNFNVIGGSWHCSSLRSLDVSFNIELTDLLILDEWK